MAETRMRCDHMDSRGPGSQAPHVGCAFLLQPAIPPPPTEDFRDFDLVPLNSVHDAVRPDPKAMEDNAVVSAQVLDVRPRSSPKRVRLELRHVDLDPLALPRVEFLEEGERFVRD